MIILTLRTDKPDSELGLYEDTMQLAYFTWPAHRILAETIHAKMQELLKVQSKQLADINGFVVYKGPGSFTGLRIGVSVANTLADAKQLPIVSETGENWLKQGIDRLQAGENERLVRPLYGAEPHITKPKH
jgi:tRNA threonylcarbamoyladenosine biosynthesis protein TsaB